ncbi:MAG: dihydroneopterin aldolase [Verrucomicrobia bacterium]|nr:MAG: dihydroneopterin aldolase [Verrucomicrobiota bacterium]
MLGTRSTALHRGNSAFWLRLTSMTGRIHLKNMAFYGYHGHHPEEGTRGQRFLVDLYLTYDMQEAANSDKLADSVDYAAVYEICKRLLEKERVKLLETLCNRLLTAILQECPRVSRVDLTIKKPSAPIPGVLEYVAVEASRDRVPSAGK